jgi:hypothetical protein
MQMIRYDKKRLILEFATLLVVGVAAFVCTAALTPQIGPQRTSRDLNGTVTDPSHEPLSGAVVQVEDENLKTVRSYTTDRTGHYSFLRLDGSVDFKVWATFRGHQSPAKTLSLFDTHPSKTIDFIVELH